MNFELSLFNFFHGFTGRAKSLDWLFIFLAKFLPYILVVVFVVLIFRLSRRARRRLYYFGFSAIALLSSWFFLVLIRFFFPRPRPYLQLGFDALIESSGSPALPSGHTTFFFALFMILFLIFKNRSVGWLYSGSEDSLIDENKQGLKITSWFLVAVLAMALSRIVVGVHWPLDIVGGIFVAFLGAILAKKLLRLSI